MAQALVVSGLIKDYGRSRALAGVDFVVNSGEVFGYLGPNGAGKTTTIRIAMGLLQPTSGSVTILGYDAWKQSPAVRRNSGYVPGEPRFAERWTGLEVLKYFSHLRQRPADVHTALRLAERFDFDPSKQIREMSRGNRQKLAVIQAFMSEPDVVILDEPSSGLDPLMQEEFHALVREAKERGAAVLLSSHILDEVQRVADRVAMIRQGILIAVERFDVLRAKALHRVAVSAASPGAAQALARTHGIQDVKIEGSKIQFRVPQSALNDVVRALTTVKFSDLSITEVDLEEMFLDYYQGDSSRVA